MGGTCIAASSHPRSRTVRAEALRCSLSNATAPLGADSRGQAVALAAEVD